MKRCTQRILAPLVILALIVSFPAFASSMEGYTADCVLNGTAPNAILTFTPNADNRPVIVIGTQYYMPDTGLIDALSLEFPNCVFVLDHSATAGTESAETMVPYLEKGTRYDLMILGDTRDFHKYFYDLSAEPFLDNYLLSALNAVSDEGHIYCVPGAATLSGIAFNVDMFNEHGWQIPETQDEFFALCEQIKAQGISPFSTCAKYIGQLNQLFTMMCYIDLFGNTDGVIWLEELLNGRADCKGYLEPMLQLVKRFADDGLMTIDDFTASLTKQRQDFWAGKYAMIDYNSSIYTYAKSEKATFELGMMPYPAKNAYDSGFAITPEYYMGILKTAAQDPVKLRLLLNVLTYLSSPEGQHAILKDSLRVSNVKNVDFSDKPEMKYAMNAYMRGNFFPILRYTNSLNIPYLTIQQEGMRSIFEGASVDEAIEYMDAQIDLAIASGAPTQKPEYEVIAHAETDFTMLETSYYMADKLREATGAQIALMINEGYFRSNLSNILAGDITSDMRRYTMKGVDAKDCLTVYELSGANIKALIEHPIVNGVEIDVLIAASGLEIVYAPWNERGNRVLRLTMDGYELMDDELYTVAAFAGVIDNSYITKTIATYESLGALPDIMLNALTKDKYIRPDTVDRLILMWPQAN